MDEPKFHTDETVVIETESGLLAWYSGQTGRILKVNPGTETTYTVQSQNGNVLTLVPERALRK